MVGISQRMRLLYVVDWNHLNSILKDLLDSNIIDTDKSSRGQSIRLTEKGRTLLEKLEEFNKILPLEKL